MIYDAPDDYKFESVILLPMFNGFKNMTSIEISA